MAARHITHEYDLVIQAEAFRSIAAVPVIVGPRPVAVRYAAHRSRHREMGRVLDEVMDEAWELEQRLAVAAADADRDSQDGDGAPPAAGSNAWALRSEITVSVFDPTLRRRLEQVKALLGPERRSEPVAVTLTGHERGVLALPARTRPTRRSPTTSVWVSTPSKVT